MSWISDAIVGDVGPNETMVLTWTICDPLKHVPVSLFLVSIPCRPQDSVLEVDRGLSLPPMGCRVLHRVTSIAFLFPRVDKQEGILSVP